MSIKITLNSDHVRAVACHMAKQDSRYCLNGLCIEIGTNRVRYIATQGHHLALAQSALGPDDTGMPDPANPVQVIIPRDAVEGALRQFKGCYTLVLESIEGSHFNVWILGDGTNKLSFVPVDGKFPDYQRVIPAYTADQVQVPAQFNPEYLACFVKSAKVYSKKGFLGLQYGPTAEDKILIRNGSDSFIGVLMPLRASVETFCATPIWVTEPDQAKKQTEETAEA